MKCLSKLIEYQWWEHAELWNHLMVKKYIVSVKFRSQKGNQGKKYVLEPSFFLVPRNFISLILEVNNTQNFKLQGELGAEIIFYWRLLIRMQDLPKVCTADTIFSQVSRLRIVAFKWGVLSIGYFLFFQANKVT